jgi:hypothetical protein
MRSARAFAVAIGAVFFVAGVVQLVHHWPAIGDWAVAELVVRHVTRHLPLSGPYSALRGYNHPLPWVYAIEWVPYRIFAGRSSAAPAMALWWNGIWVAVVIWMLGRRNAIGLAVVALCALLLMANRTEGVVLLIPWNPNLAVVPAFALLFVAWRVASGESRLLPVAVGLALWCFGAHLGFLPLAAVVMVTATVALVVVTVVDGGRAALRSLLRPAAVALAVAAVLLSPMIADVALHGSHSNPAHILDHTGPGKPHAEVPHSDVLKVFRAELAIPPAWSRSRAPYDVLLYRPAAQLPLALVFIALALIAAWRRRARDELIGMTLLFLALCAATFGLWLIDDSMLQPWYLLPADVAGASLFAFVAWSGSRSIAALVQTRSERRVAVPGSVCTVGFAAVVVVTALAVFNMRTPYYFAPIAATTEQLAKPIERQIPKGAHLVIDGPVRSDGFFSQSLTLQLDKAGYAIRVPNDDLYMYTAALAIPPRWNGTTITITISGPGSPPPTRDATLIASVVVPARLEFAGQTISAWVTRG